MHSPLRLLALAGVLAAGTAHAQGSMQILLGFGGDNLKNVNESVPVAGAYDVNGDGVVDVNDPQELFGLVRKVFSTNGGNGAFIYDAQTVIQGGELATYYADGGDGYILRAIDANANGVYDDNEVVDFYKFGGTGTRTYGPNTLAAGTLGGLVLYVGCDDGNNSRPETGVYKLQDLNNDGDAKDSGEVVKLFDKNSKLPFTGKSGPVTLATDDWQCLRTLPLPPQRFVAWNDAGAQASSAADAWCYYGFQESAGKITSNWVFFNPSKNNGLPENADIASGALEDMDLKLPGTATPANGVFNGFQFCEVNPLENGRQGAFYFANTYGPTRSYGSQNAKGNSLQGVVLRGVDLNRDGDLQDKGEVTIFFNGSGNALQSGGAPSPVVSWFDTARQQNVNQVTGFCTGLSVSNGVVFLLIENGSQDAVLALDDKNQNGVIEQGEASMPYYTPSNYPRVFSAQYGPYTLNLHTLDPDWVVDPMPAGATPFGMGCQNNGGLILRPSVIGEPKIGNQNFQFSLKRANPSAAAFLFFGLSNKVFGPIQLPLALDGLGMTGCAQLVSPDLFVSPTVATASGRCVLPFPIPNDTGFRGISLHTQWWAQDGSVNSAGLITSSGLTITIQ